MSYWTEDPVERLEKKKDELVEKLEQPSSRNGELLYTELKRLAKASLDAREEEARALMSLDNAKSNFSQDDWEVKNYERKVLAAVAADKALREAL